MGPSSYDWRKSLVLCLLCGLYFLHSMHIAQLFLKLWIICICELHAKHIKNTKQISHFILALFRRVSKSTVADTIKICLCRWHRGADPHPPSSTRGKETKNHLTKEITPLLPTGIGERFSQTISNLGYAALLRRCELSL